MHQLTATIMNHNGKKQNWLSYQKNIAENDYFYVRSCIRQTFFPGSEATFLNILRNNLSKQVFEDARHTSCTGIGYHSDIIPLETIMTIVARQFALMTESGYRNFLVSCVTSFGIYNEIVHMWEHHPEMLEKARELLYKATKREFGLPADIAHTSDVIYKFRHQIRDQARYTLVDANSGEPLRIAEHVGCHYAKIFPERGVGGAEFPQVLSGMIEAWGGNVLDYPERRHCCGFGFRHYILRENRGYPMANTLKKLESLAPCNPDLIVCNCPGCTMFMDRWQYTAGEMEGRTFGHNGRGIPVLTYEELAGLVLGYDPWDLGLQMHQVDVEPLLQKMGYRYDQSGKYLGNNRKYLGQPMGTEYCCL
jgi:heterodisulfide reductase subunit B